MSQRKLNIEFARVIATVLVISIHVANVYIRSFGEVANSDFLVAVVFSSIARVCVPLFFMISGMFSAGGNYERKKYLSRVIRFVVVLFVWSVIYYFTKNGFAFEGIGKVIANSFFNANKTSRHLWYMYPLISIFIALPFIQVICKNITREQENLFMILWFILSGLSFVYLPLAKVLSGQSVALSYPVPLLNSAYYVGYFIIGHILAKRFENVKFNKKRNLLCVGVYTLLTLAIILVTYIVSIKKGRLFEGVTYYRSAPVIIAAVAVFLLVLCNPDRFKNPKILKLSKHSFGIYLSHMLFLNIIKHYIDIAEFNPLLAIPVITVLVYISSLVFCAIISKIKFLRNILF